MDDPSLLVFCYRELLVTVSTEYGVRVPDRVASGLFGYREFLDRSVVLVI